MERLEPIDDDVAQTIDSVVTKEMSVADVGDPTLRRFLEAYVEMPIDQDSRNVMVRGNDYVIIDPE